MIKPTDYKYGFSQPDTSIYKTKKGLNNSVVEEISNIKTEPEWMLKFRLKALSAFNKLSIPGWANTISDIDFDKITYFIKPWEREEKSWKDVPKEIRQTYEKLGIPKAEKKLLAGLKAQYDSEIIYGSVLKKLKKQGVIFTSMDEGLKKYPKLVKRYFGTIVPPDSNKFAALNSAVWSGGSFIYIPKNVKIDLPLQAYFRINAPNFGQFERTLIIAEDNSFIHYIEGCTAPIYSEDSLHAAVVEIIVKKGARVRYTTVQNWSKNVYNLVTKRANVFKDAVMEWVDCNLGSKISMKYPSCYLLEPGAKGNMLSLSYADGEQHQDNGAKMVHNAPNTSSRIISKSISINGGRSSYRGLVKVKKGARNSRAKVECNALILDSKSRADTYPTLSIDEDEVKIGHEAVVSKIEEDQLFYLRSRGISYNHAVNMIVSGFIEPIIKELPLEYAVEMNRLIRLDMKESVG